jgi:hypothetical protein
MGRAQSVDGIFTGVVDWRAEKLIAEVVRDGVNFHLRLKSDCCIRIENDPVVIDVTRQTAGRIMTMPPERCWNRLK